MATEWRPCGLLNGTAVKPYAVLILNQPVNENALRAVVQSATLLVCADAGADRLRKYEMNLKNGLRSKVPDVIVGDLDSLTLETRQYYERQGVSILSDSDQYTTDFTKALKWIRQTARDRLQDIDLDVVVLGGLGGRVDQAFSQIHHLYMAANDTELLRGCIYLLSEQSLSFVLADGKNIIFVEKGNFEQNVGVIPITGPTNITLSGFEWDVTDWPTEFGGQVSTSNHIRSDKLEVSFTGKPPLFTVELAAELQAGNLR